MKKTLRIILVIVAVALIIGLFALSYYVEEHDIGIDFSKIMTIIFCGVLVIFGALKLIFPRKFLRFNIRQHMHYSSRFTENAAPTNAPPIVDMIVGAVMLVLGAGILIAVLF